MEKIQGLHLLKFGNILIGMNNKTPSPLKTLTQQYLKNIALYNLTLIIRIVLLFSMVLMNHFVYLSIGL
jgi:hypothetical protein